MELYLDGRKVGEGKSPAAGRAWRRRQPRRSTNTVLHGGRTVDQPGCYFAGRIDDFRIVNRALAGEEIRALAEGR